MASPQPVTFDLDTAVYRLAAVKKAAYRFGDRCHVELATAEPDRVKVTLTPKRLIEDAAYLAGEFRNEALDQELREVVAEETRGVRDVLLAQAFSATALLDAVGESADAAMDPLGIRAADRAGGPGEPGR
jgi:His-Xaa-Ser system protein HxsD